MQLFALVLGATAGRKAHARLLCFLVRGPRSPRRSPFAFLFAGAGATSASWLVCMSPFFVSCPTCFCLCPAQQSFWMCSACHPWAEPSEQLQFATEVGFKRGQTRAETIGDNTLHGLKGCPAAPSLGMQVNQRKRPWLWMRE